MTQFSTKTENIFTMSYSKLLYLIMPFLMRQLKENFKPNIQEYEI